MMKQQIRTSIKKILINSCFVSSFYELLTFPKRFFSKKDRRPNYLAYKKVSAVILSYNYSQYLEKRIDSVLSQTYPLFEIIILDDGSTDESDYIIKEYIKKHPEKNIKYIKNKKNSGKAINQWQKAFSIAKGDYVWICEADDFCSKDFLIYVMNGFEKEEVAMSYSESRLINQYGRIIQNDYRAIADKTHSDHWQESYTNDGKNEIENYLSVNCTIPNVSGVVFNKMLGIPFENFLEEAKNFSQVGDWYFYIKILSKWKIYYCRNSLNYFRIHKKSVTNQSGHSKKHLEEIIAIQNLVQKNFSISKKIREQITLEQKRIRSDLG